MPNTIFLNLPVNDLEVSVRFYEAIGCEKNEALSDDRSAVMMCADVTFQLLTHDYFASVSPKPLADPRATAGALMALPCDSRDEVDAVTAAAAAAGGRADVRAPLEMGFLYNRAFEDPDGHLFEALYLDLEALGSAATAGSEAR